MNELWKIPGCASDKASQLRFLYDKISINVRGLESLGVSSSQYGSLLIPVIMYKLPQGVRVRVARNNAQEVWQMSDLLGVFRHQVKAREISEGVKTQINVEKLKPAQIWTPSSAALIVNNGSRTSCYGNQVTCVYCGDSHFSASCERVSDRQDRIEVLNKDRRCFVCSKPVHHSNSCVKNCPRCQGNHHESICRHTLPKRDDSSAPNENQLHEPQISTCTSHTTEYSFVLHSTTTASFGTKNNVLPQTATAIVKNEEGTWYTKVKILFDSGSQRSYFTDNLKTKHDLKSTKTEMLHLNTFWEKKVRKQKCDVLTLVLEDRDKKDVEVSALILPAIYSPLLSRTNSNNYPHLHGLNLPDCSSPHDSADVLIGSDHHDWDLFTNEIVRGDFGPTANFVGCCQVQHRSSQILNGLSQTWSYQEPAIAYLNTHKIL